jgi:aspartate aminotransferase-like enzyme
MAEATHAWVAEMSAAGIPLEVVAPDGYRSPAVTAIRTGAKTGPDIVGAARELGFVIGGGYGKLKDSTFRIGHMGEKTIDELVALLDVLGEVVA